MPKLITQKDLRKAHDLPFCYLCGKAFESREQKTRDHVPPKAIFRKQDRDAPLILHAHAECNEAQRRTFANARLFRLLLASFGSTG